MRDVKEDTKKIVRILLRVSSDQQFKADGFIYSTTACCRGG